jgi:hypothetical protein
MPEPTNTAGAPKPVDLMRAADIALTARQDTSAGLVAREQLVPIMGGMVAEIGALRETVTAYREDLEDARAALALAENARDNFMRACHAEAQGGAARLAIARSFRLAHPFMAVDPAVHTPERVAAYLTARGWQQRENERGFWDLGDDETVFVHRVATASDYAGRTGLLVSDLASIYKTGELGVLADIEEAVR